MSTSPNTAILFPDWKQEVSRRVAAHMRSKTQSAGETAAHAENRRDRGSRAAQAAARVAARYANVPSYNEMLTREARAAVQAAEAASKAAQQAQAAFQYVLDGLEAANSAELDRRPELVNGRHAGPVAVAPAQKPPQRPQIQQETAMASAVAPSWELETDAQLDEIAHYEALSRQDRASIYERPSIYERQPMMEAYPGEVGGPVQPDEFAQPIHANLIEFPREMVATRRVRPRRAEGPLAEAGCAPQLSIFEVDPAAVSTQPAPATMDPPEAPEWMRPEWPAMTLEPLPSSTNFEAQTTSMDFEASAGLINAEASPSAMSFAAHPPTLDLEAQSRQQLVEEFLEEPAPKAALVIKAAPLSRRLLATFVDCTLIAGALVAAATLAAFNVGDLPGLRAMEFSAAVALLAIGIAYHICFMTLARATPGMKYAGIEIKTLSGHTTTRGQRCGRLLALLPSILTLGLGVVWAFFDESHLTWHDRLSKTYLRKR